MSPRRLQSANDQRRRPRVSVRSRARSRARSRTRTRTLLEHLTCCTPRLITTFWTLHADRTTNSWYNVTSLQNSLG